MVQAVGAPGEKEGCENGVVDFPRRPAADVSSAMQRCASLKGWPAVVLRYGLPRHTGRPLGRPPKVTSLEAQRLACQQSYFRARAADPDHAAFYSKLFADVTAAATAVDSYTATLLYMRVIAVFDVSIDRLNWPHDITGLVRPRL